MVLPYGHRSKRQPNKNPLQTATIYVCPEKTKSQRAAIKTISERRAPSAEHIQRYYIYIKLGERTIKSSARTSTSATKYKMWIAHTAMANHIWSSRRALNSSNIPLISFSRHIHIGARLSRLCSPEKPEPYAGAGAPRRQFSIGRQRAPPGTSSISLTLCIAAQYRTIGLDHF